MSMDQATPRLRQLEGPTGMTSAEIIYMRALSLVELARECGLVLTINTQPRHPLSMGNYDMHVDVRTSNKAYRGAA